MKKRKRTGNARVVFTSLILLVLVALGAWKLKSAHPKEQPPKQETADVQPPKAEPKEPVQEPEQPAEELKEPAELLDEPAKLAEFLPDYTSAPLLSTTPIKCLSMEVGANADELQFNWFSPSGAKGRVEWKDSSGNVKSFDAQCTASVTLPGYYVNIAKVTGLQAGETYGYRVGNDEAWSPEYTYQAPEDTESLTFLVTADAQVGQSEMEDPRETAERWDSVLTRLAGCVPEANFLFHLGDQVADFGNAEHYDLFLDHLALYRIPLAPVVGNHDVANDYSIEENGHPGGPYFFEHFFVPNRSNAGQSQYDTDGDYYFIRDNVLFIVLNSSTIQPAEVHEAYVAQIVSEHPEAKWRILVQHYPAYKGTTGSGNGSIKEYLARITIDNDIDLVLSAHDHAYSRTAFVNREMETLNDYDYASGDTVTNPEGTMYVTCGTSSGCLYHPIEEEIRIVYQGQPEVPSAIRIDVTDTELHLRTYLADTWTVYDEYTIRKE